MTIVSALRPMTMQAAALVQPAEVAGAQDAAAGDDGGPATRISPSPAERDAQRRAAADAVDVG